MLRARAHSPVTHKETCTKGQSLGTPGTNKRRARGPEMMSRAMLGRPRGHKTQVGPLLEQLKQESARQKGSGL